MISSFLVLSGYGQKTGNYDVVVYGGSASGIIAAVEVARSGKSVVIVEPSKRIGGMPTSGLGETDHGKGSTVSGLTRSFFEKVGAKYGKSFTWRFEPKVALQVFQEMLKENNIPYYTNELIDLKNGVKMNNLKIESIKTESGKVFKGKMFIDASYEGDLMALAGVSYFVGRESNSEFNEVGNGIRQHKVKPDKNDKFPERLLPPYNEMPYGVSPYIIKDDPKSGLLPRVNPDAGGVDGQGDKKMPAYCYRLCLTNDPNNRIMIEKPEGYNELEYELFLRAIEKGMPKDRCFKLSPMPNKKTDSNNHYGISMDYNGGNWDYPEADHKKRAEIAKQIELYQRGFVWTVQNHDRVPQEVKNYYAGFGLPKDEFLDNNHWPVQLYVRESRRMRGDYVITEHDCLRKVVSDRGIALGSYAMDSHNTQYFVNKDGYANTEGGYFWILDKAYPIDYRAIVPKKGECSNLLVTVCVSVTHAAYGSIRQEPCYMMIAHAAGAAASLAIDKRVSVQNVEYSLLKNKLLNEGQKLVDDDNSKFSGNETEGN